MCCNSNDCCKGGCKCSLAKAGQILVLVGALNWGLVGLGELLGTGMNWNIVGMIFGSMPVIEAIIYLLVGISAVVSIFGCPCKKCKSGVCTVHGAKDAEKSM